MKTAEHIGKVAYMKGGFIPDFIGGGSNEDFANAGLTPIGLIQTTDCDGVNVNFAEIIGEVDPSMFTAIMTKEAANTLIRSWFVPEYEVTRDEYFKRYLDFYLTPAHLQHIATLSKYQDILAYLLSEGFKFIKATEFTGPQFDV